MRGVADQEHVPPLVPVPAADRAEDAERPFEEVRGQVSNQRCSVRELLGEEAFHGGRVG